MKVVWLSSVSVLSSNKLLSGTWIPGLLALLKAKYTKELELVNITHGPVSQAALTRSDFVNEWLIPKSLSMSSSTIKYIEDIILTESPDLVQVWGTEDIWGEFPFKEKFPNLPVLLEIQGILSSVSENFYGELSAIELLKCWRIKECLKPSSSLPGIRHLYSRNIKREEKIIKLMDNIGVQSSWVADMIKIVNPSAELFKSGIALRTPFYNSPKWDCNHDRVRIFSTAIMGQPLKGAYTLFKAFSIVKRQFPNAQLILAGAKEEGIKRSGFCRLLTNYAKKEGFWSSVIHLGPISAEQLTKQYAEASLFVNPSNCESYSLVMAEAMYIGCPTVASYSGAMPELGVDNSVLYFPKGDYMACAARIMEILYNPLLAEKMSKNSIKIGEERQDPSAIAQNQMGVYNKLLLNKSY